MEYKYEYYLKTWGGFYNKEHKHDFPEGDFWFSTLEERDNYINQLKEYQNKHPEAKMLMIHLDEGFNMRVPTVLHRVIEYNGKQYYSTNELWFGYDYDSAKYMLEWKWTPGFNDYPLGEDFDYGKVNIVEEWITGSFKFKPE